MNKILKKGAAAVLALIIGAAQFVMIQPVSAFGAETATVGDFAVTGDSGGYTYSNNVLKITSGGTYKITMASGVSETTADRIEVNADGDVTLTISDINITSSADSPLSADGGDLTLILEGDNYLTPTNSICPGLRKASESNTLKITSIKGDGSLAGSLTAVGGRYGAGIGGGRGEDGINIEIAGGTVDASADSGAGIGGGCYDKNDESGYYTQTVGKNITISGGAVAASSYAGAGIGGGHFGGNENIKISGGYIKASSEMADCIGNGYNTHMSGVEEFTEIDLTITGGFFGSFINDRTYNSCISSGYKVYDNPGSITGEEYPYVVAKSKPGGDTEKAFSISGVNSSGGSITENTEYTYESNILTVNSGGTYSISMVEYPNVNSTSTDRIIVSAGSSESVTLTITDINITNSEYAPFRAESGNLTLILEGDNYLKSSASAYAALSKNSNSNTLKITSIDGDGSSTGSLTAAGSSDGAGIGGDRSTPGNGITIAGGTVSATAGSNAAAIGGGYNSTCNVEITGGTVTAKSGSYGAAIGGGDNADGSTTGNTIKISGGIIAADAVWGAAIGGGYQAGGDVITISGGLFRLSSAYGATMGCGYGGNTSIAIITGGYFRTGDTSAKTVYGVSVLSGYSVVSTGSSRYAYRVVPSSYTIDMDFEISGNVSSGDSILEDYDYSYEDNVLTILSGGIYGITMADGVTSTETDRIAVQADGDVTLTITNINITSSEGAPFRADSGDLTLILEGDNYLTSTNTNYPGLSKTSSSNTLKITSIEGDGKTTGALTATGGSSSAGIGGGNGGAGQNITISGGTVNAICNDNSGAGIGGGKEGYGINITISGGNVTATGGGYGAGIGGGNGGAGQNITISGGTVVATCDRSDTDIRSAGSGIGGGMYGRYAYPESSNITITGGDITAIGGLYGAGIGGGRSCSVTGITISGGTVYAESANGAAIGAGYGAVGNNITISGGTVNAQSTGAVGIGGSVTGGSGSNVKISNADVTAYGLYNGIYATGITISSGTVNASSNFTAIGYDDVTITGGTVTAEATIGAGIGDTNITITGGTVTASGEQGAGIGGGIAGFGSGITISGGYIKASSVEGEAIGSGLDGAASENIVITGGHFNEGSQEDNTVCGAEVYTDYYVYLNTEEDTKAAYPYVAAAIGYSRGLVITGDDIAEGEDYTYENNVLTVLKAGAYTVAMSEGTVKTPDRIAVNSGGDVELTISGINISSTESPLKAESGNLTLILSGDSCLTAGGDNYAALSKETEDYKLIITSIKGSGSTEGSLTASGGSSGAGIGGGYNGKGTGIEIAGGTVTASSGQYGAGIGGGRYESGSDITISGGNVTASSTDMGAGIGGGQASNGTSSGSGIAITGGTVTASSSRGAAIGGGYSSSGISLGEDITISGGAVTAVSESGAGIGAGANFSDNAAAGSYARGIRIAGGTVSAAGYSAIGCGSTGGTAEAEAPIIDGGSVKANGGFSTEPINSAGEAVALYTVENTAEGEKITVNGKTYVESVVYHSADDTNQYIYLTAADLISLGVIGDVDGDGDVDKADGALLLKYLSNLTALAEERLDVSDCNLDGSIDLTDVTALLKSVKH